MKRISPLPPVRNLLLALSVLLLLAGCGRSVPVSYYQLTPVRGEEPATAATTAGNLVIGIGPVQLQEHLDRPQLVLRSGVNRLRLADRHRWAEPLAANIAWVLRDNLAALLATEQILLHPWERSAQVDRQVILSVLHCEAMEDGTAHLAAIWSVAGRDGKILLPPRRSSFRIPRATPDEEGLVRALSEALRKFSLEVAEALVLLPRDIPGHQP
jgi:hypothetical protein